MKRFGILLLFCVLASWSEAQTTLDTAVNFQVKDTHGTTHRLFDILDQNKYVVLNIHSTSCGPCVTYAPDMQQAYVQYGMNAADVYFLGIVWGASNNAVLSFDSTYGITYPCASGSQGNGNAVILSFDIQSYPTAILIAPDRHIVNKYMYPPSFQVVDSNLMAVLGTTAIPITPGFLNQVNAIKVVPNPVSQKFSLNFNLASRIELGFAVFNILGEKVAEIQERVYAKGEHSLDFDSEVLQPGIYFVKETTGQQQFRPVTIIKK